MFGEPGHFRGVLDETKANDGVFSAGHPKGHGCQVARCSRVGFPYRSDGLARLCFFRRGGQTGASGSSLPLILFLLASRWTYVPESTRKAGFSERSIRVTDLLCPLNPRPLYWVVPKDTIVYVTVFDPNIFQGLRNFCWRVRRWIVFIREFSVRPQKQMSFKLAFI